MKAYRLIMSVVCLVAAVSLFAQNDFNQGYIIQTNQDTVYGQIRINSESRNARTCVFRTGEHAEASQYSPGEISAYRVTDGKYYVSMTIVKDGRQRQVFLEYLVNGMADLYYLREDNTESYYIQKEGEEALELTDIRLLKAAFSDCYEIQSSLDRASLNHKSLVNMTVKYHDYVCEGEACINYSKQASRLMVKVGPVIGYSISSLRFKGRELFQLFDFESNQSPVFGVLADLSSNRLGKHVSFQIGASYSQHSYSTWTEVDGIVYYVDYSTYDVSLDSPLLSFQFGSRYGFRETRINPFLGGGLELSKFINTDFSYTEDMYYINWETATVSTTWTGNPVASMLFGVYAEAGTEVKLSEKLALEATVKAGYLSSNPVTIMAIREGDTNQMRVRPEMIPVSFRIALLF